jgi:RNA methyltransferase, TrmH family
MFPLSKLRELSPKTRLRKAARILQSLEMDLAGGRAPDRDYLDALLSLLAREEASAPGVGETARRLQQELADGAEPPEVLRGLNSIRHGILQSQNAEPSEWDLVSPGSGLLDRSSVKILPFAVYLEDIRSPFNVGSIFRTAEALGVQRILLSPRTPLPTHPRARKTAMGAAEVIPWEVAELTAVTTAGGAAGAPREAFALELGGTPLDRFSFPRNGVVLVGSEELGLSPEALALADASRGRVSIPLAGAKRSLNVSVAFGILMQAWHASVAAP